MASIADKVPSSDPVEAASRLHDRAVAYREQGRHRQVLPLCLCSLRLLEEAAGPDHPDVANVLNTLAAICQDQDDYAEAGGGDMQRVRAQALGGLANHYRVQGRYR